MKNIFSKYEGFIFDLDGTLYRGDEVIPGAVETVNNLKNMGKKLLFVSNKTTGTREEYAQLLYDSGMQIAESEIITATEVTVRYLLNHHRGETFFAISEEAFRNAIIKSGLHFTSSPADIRIVIVTLDRYLDFNKLETASKAIEAGARFFAANVDDTCPVEDGEIIDAGSTIAALEKRTNRKLELFFGKPSLYMIREIEEYLNLSASQILLVGDRLETDIAMANFAGFDSALVLSGVKNHEKTGYKPSFILQSVSELLI